MKYIYCYRPRINLTDLGDHILVPEEKVYDYTKTLYERALETKVNPTGSEEEIHNFFRWKIKISRLGYIKKKIIKFLLG